MSIKLLDVVALTDDFPEYNLRRGQVGTVVESLAGGTAFEVEFSDRDGWTYESVGVRSDQSMGVCQYVHRHCRRNWNYHPNSTQRPR